MSRHYDHIRPRRGGAPIRSAQAKCLSENVKYDLDDMRDQLLHKAGGNGRDNHFYPQEVILRVMTEKTIEDVLACECGTCQSDQQLLPPECYADRRRYLPEIKSGALRLFTALTAMHHPALIGGFEYYHAMTDEISGKEDILANDILGRRQDTERLIRLFRRRMLQFSPTRLRNDHFQKFAPDQAFPFFDEQKIGEGAYGAVYSFRIYPGYSNFGSGGGDIKYARKEVRIDGSFSSSWTQEYRVVQELVPEYGGGEHIIRMHKSYIQGDILNCIMPLADGSLYAYLHNEKSLRKAWAYEPQSGVPLHKNGIWEQFISLIRAFHKFQSPDDRSRRAFHSDLKPRNILVYDAAPAVSPKPTGEGKFGGTLVIADFGQAHIKNRRDDEYSTSTNQRAGTDAYLPPECDSGYKMDTKYDVWSMGCILLEILVYATRGSPGILKLEEHRQKTTSDFYRQKDNSSGKWVVHPHVVQYLDEIGLELASSDSEFFSHVREVIRGMMDVKRKWRINCLAAADDLAEALASANAGEGQRDAYPTRQSARQSRNWTPNPPQARAAVRPPIRSRAPGAGQLGARKKTSSDSRTGTNAPDLSVTAQESGPSLFSHMAEGSDFDFVPPAAWKTARTSNEESASSHDSDHSEYSPVKRACSRTRNPYVFNPSSKRRYFHVDGASVRSGYSEESSDTSLDSPQSFTARPARSQLYPEIDPSRREESNGARVPLSQGDPTPSHPDHAKHFPPPTTVVPPEIVITPIAETSAGSWARRIETNGSKRRSLSVDLSHEQPKKLKPEITTPPSSVGSESTSIVTGTQETNLWNVFSPKATATLRGILQGCSFRASTEASVILSWSRAHGLFEEILPDQKARGVELWCNKRYFHLITFDPQPLYHGRKIEEFTHLKVAKIKLNVTKKKQQKLCSLRITPGELITGTTYTGSRAPGDPQKYIRVRLRIPEQHKPEAFYSRIQRKSKINGPPP